MADKLITTQGDTLDFTITVTDSASVAVNITDATLVCKVYNCGTVLTTKTVTSHTTPISGITTISFSTVDTAAWPIGLLKYELRLTTAASKVYTDTGILEVKKDI